MDIVVSAFIGMFIGAMLAVVFFIAVTSYREYQQEVNSKFKAAKKEMQTLKDKQQEISDRMKATESTLVEIKAERRKDDEGY